MIIGAGPAGSLAATLLARAGFAVTLVEQQAFPRDKVCGECLSATGIDVLSRHGLSAFPIAPVELHHTQIHCRDGSSCSVRLPRPMWGVTRFVLDSHLLHCAKRAGVRVLQPARCEWVDSGWRVRDLRSNHVETIDAEFILRADGKALAAKTTGDFGIKTHFTAVDGPRDAIELFAVAGSYGGLAPIDGDRWNAAFSVPAERLRLHHGDVAALFGEITRENIALAQRLRNARRTGAWLASPLPRFGVESQWAPNVIPIGNAAAAIEPVGGEGMGLALASAELAAMTLIQARRSSAAVNLRRLRAQYRRLWGLRGAACRTVALAVSSRSITAFLAPALNGSEGVSGAAMALMGK